MRIARFQPPSDALVRKYPGAAGSCQLSAIGSSRLRENSGLDFALKGCGFSRAVRAAKSMAALQVAEKLTFRIRASLYSLRKNSGFVSGDRFSDTVTPSKSDAPLGFGREVRLFRSLLADPLRRVSV